jgi:pyridoxal phosphate enzyme (YggS family)
MKTSDVPDTETTSAEEISENLHKVRARIDEAARATGRKAEDITLVAVSKGHNEAAIRAALDAGQRVFGENRVQEAQTKWPALKATYSDARLHLIGPLQTNKTADALELFNCIETVDRARLGAKIRLELDRSGNAAPSFLLQVNTGEEPQKAGVAPGDVDAMIKAVSVEYGLTLSGLMCIPPATEEPAMHFALLAKLASRNNLQTLSMGMSGDFETAIAFGATHVRVGTAIFGTRVPKSG